LARHKAMVNVYRPLRELEQTYCRGDTAEEEEFKRKYEEMKARVEAEERVKLEQDRLRKRVCLIDYDESTVDEGVECQGPEKHFVCRGCFSDQVRVQCGADCRGNFTRHNRLVVCAFCTEPFEERVVASRCPADTYALYSRTREEVIVVEEQEKHQKHIDQLREQLASMNGRNAAVHRHRLHIAENILTLHCPRVGCGAAILDFDGCMAVTCDRCKCGFCGWCLADCGADAHDHVKKCVHSLRKGGFYGSQAEFNQVHRQRRGAAVTAYLATILDGEERRLVQQQIEGDLRDLGITLMS
jgi:translation initiation factor 1 (eIF-1/SUI1)